MEHYKLSWVNKKTPPPEPLFHRQCNALEAPKIYIYIFNDHNIVYLVKVCLLECVTLPPPQRNTKAINSKLRCSKSKRNTSVLLSWKFLLKKNSPKSDLFFFFFSCSCLRFAVNCWVPNTCLNSQIRVSNYGCRDQKLHCFDLQQSRRCISAHY